MTNSRSPARPRASPATGVAIWIFGTNYYSRTTQSVNDDGTFSYTLARGTTQNLATGQYFAVVQHPMTNGVFDVDEVVEGGVTRVYDTSGNFFVADGPGRLQGSDAANALVNLINGPNIDDTYTKLSFAVEEASIQVDAPDIRQGDQLLDHGHDQPGGRGQPAGDDPSTSFEPTDKSQASGFSGVSGTTTVQRGTAGGNNTFNFTADSSQLQPDTYQVTVESPQAGVTQSETFQVTEGGGNVTTTATAGGNVTATIPAGTTAATAGTHGERHGDAYRGPGLRNARCARRPRRCRTARRGPARLKQSFFFAGDAENRAESMGPHRPARAGRTAGVRGGRMRNWSIDYKHCHRGG